MVAHEPRTLQEAILHFADYANCHAAMVAVRWPDGVIKCPTCGSDKVTYLATVRRWKCYAKHTKPQFSLKTGTVFEDSPLPLQKWLPALWLLTNCKNGISSYELARALGVTQKTAWFMLHRLRLALQLDSAKFDGEVEVDETFIGGQARNMHKSKRDRVMKGKAAGRSHMVPVVGAIKRGANGEPSKVVARVVADTKRASVMPFVRQHVKAEDAILYTDALRSYEQHPVEPEFVHQVIDHAVAYVQGDIHTNSAENFWSLVKRMLKGTYVSVEPFHLFRYLDEQVFRFNERRDDDGGRFKSAIKGVTDRRLTYKALTGKLAEESTAN
jgi:transposase-like protein